MQRAVGGAVTPEMRRRTGIYVVLLFALLAALAGLLFLLAKEVGIVGEGTAAKVEVPNVLTFDREAAINLLEARSLKAKVVEENNAADPEIVFDQNPKSGERVDKNSEVIVKVSLGLTQVTVKNVVGQQRGPAEARLKSDGFKVLFDEKKDNSAEPGDGPVPESRGRKSGARGFDGHPDDRRQVHKPSKCRTWSVRAKTRRQTRSTTPTDNSKSSERTRTRAR